MYIFNIYLHDNDKLFSTQSNVQPTLFRIDLTKNYLAYRGTIDCKPQTSQGPSITKSETTRWNILVGNVNKIHGSSMATRDKYDILKEYLSAKQSLADYVLIGIHIAGCVRSSLATILNSGPQEYKETYSAYHCFMT